MTSFPPPIPRPQPVTASERLLAWDVLRGFALLGILLVNMQEFSRPTLLESLLQIYPWEGSWNVDILAYAGLVCLVGGKFYLIYSFLFGMGIQFMCERTAQRGGSVARTLLRRLGVLFVFGVVHMLFIWFGDILTYYAVMGLIILAFRRMPARGHLIAFYVIVGLYTLVMMGFGLIGWLGELVSPGSGAFTEDDWMYQHYLHTLETLAGGTWLEIFLCRLINAGLGFLFAIFYLPLSLAMMFLGVWALKSNLHTRTDADTGAWLKKVCRLTLPAGLFFNFLIMLGEVGWVTNISYIYLVVTPAMCLGFPLLSIGYITGVILIVRKRPDRALLRWIAAAGRMPLTNYLLQSLIGTWIFYSYGTGLYGSVGDAGPLALAVSIYGAQLVFSQLWLSRFRYGPMEWLWRFTTYQKRP